MAGFIKINRLSRATGTYGRTNEEYRFSYVTGSTEWVRNFDMTGLEDFLTSEIGLVPERATAAVNQARLQGSVTIPAVEISVEGAEKMGLAEFPSDQ